MPQVRSSAVFARAVAASAALLFCVAAATAQTSPAPVASPAPPAAAATPAPPAASADAPPTAPVDQLMTIGPLPDIVQGSPNAPSTIIEYASLTCTHCAAFHETVWPQLKAKWVDTGQAKFILREFPLDPLATAGFMLARCAGPDKRNLLVDQLYSQQKAWAFVDKPIQPLFDIVKTTGMTQADFETCLKNQELYEQVNQSRERAAEAFNIDTTPTFFVNGRKIVGEVALSDFERWLGAPVK